jgi:hypothetical protein
MGTPVWSHDGIVCTGQSYKQVLKLTFARGATIEDPNKLFNASLERMFPPFESDFSAFLSVDQWVVGLCARKM